jgi:hypothetical protein
MSDQDVVNIEKTIKQSLKKQLTDEAYEALLGAVDIDVIATKVWLDNVVPIIESKDLKIEALEDEIENLNEEKEELESEFEESD